MLHKNFKNYDNIHYLMPGELYIAKIPVAVWTVLGSCVSVIFHHKKTGIGAICHAQLPGKTDDANCFDNCPEQCRMDSSRDNQFKYVICSVKYMVNQFKNLNIPLAELEVAVFGGADVIPNKNKTSVGKLNIEAAFNILKEEGLTVTRSDTGGTSGRNILFISGTGEILTETHSEKKAELDQKK